MQGSGWQLDAQTPELRSAFRGHLHHARVLFALYPTLLREVHCKGGTQCAAEVVPPLRPVQAGAGKLAAFAAQSFEVQPKPSQGFFAGPRYQQLPGIRGAALQPFFLKQHGQQAGTQAAGQVVIAKTGPLYGIACRCFGGLASVFGRYPHQRLHHLRHLLRGETEVLVAALRG
jgi:hypothetical protein